MQGRVWHTMTELAGKSLTVAGVSLTLAPLSMTGKVIVWHAMTQNWQVRLLMTANQWSVRGFCISIWTNEIYANAQNCTSNSLFL